MSLSTVAPEEIVPIDARWMHNGVLHTGAATVIFSAPIEGVNRYWDGSAWVSTPAEFDMEFSEVLQGHRYDLVVPVAWVGLAVRYLCLAGYRPTLVDSLRVDASVLSRASASQVSSDVGKVS